MIEAKYSMRFKKCPSKRLGTKCTYFTSHRSELQPVFNKVAIIFSLFIPSPKKTRGTFLMGYLCIYKSTHFLQMLLKNWVFYFNFATVIKLYIHFCKLASKEVTNSIFKIHWTVNQGIEAKEMNLCSDPLRMVLGSQQRDSRTCSCRTDGSGDSDVPA